MSNIVGKFSKVSFDQFKKDYEECLKNYEWSYDNSESVEKVYDNIKLPSRATYYSAGYDFYLPISLKIPSNEEVLIPSGIRCRVNPDYLLMMCPKSGLGFKYGFKLSNTLGIIDADYYHSDNEGHIMIKFSLDNNTQEVSFNSGIKLCQGIFLPFGVTENDHEDLKVVRNGGFGSTS